MLKKILSVFQPEQPVQETPRHADIFSEAMQMFRRFGSVYMVSHQGLMNLSVTEALALSATQDVSHLSVYGVSVAKEYGEVQDGDFNVTPDLIAKHPAGTEVFFVFPKRNGTFTGDVAEQIIVDGITYKGEQAALIPVTELMLPTRRTQVQFLTPATRPHMEIAQAVCMDLLEYLLELGTQPQYRHYTEKAQMEKELNRFYDQIQEEVDSEQLLIHDASGKKSAEVLVVAPALKPAKTPKLNKIIHGILGPNPVYSFMPVFLFRTIGAELAKNGMNPEDKLGDVLNVLYAVDAEWTIKNVNNETLLTEMNEGAKAHL